MNWNGTGTVGMVRYLARRFVNGKIPSCQRLRGRSPVRKIMAGIMKTREEIVELLEGRRPVLQHRYGVRRIALFGSYARGEQREDSDVDILVDVDPLIGLNFVSLADELEELLGVHVELVSERAVKPRNLDRIRKDLIDVGSA